MLVSISSMACHAWVAVLSRDGKYPKIPGTHGSGPPSFNGVLFSIDRRRQGVRYALLAPLPLAFHRAVLSALTV